MYRSMSAVLIIRMPSRLHEYLNSFSFCVYNNLRGTCPIAYVSLHFFFLYILKHPWSVSIVYRVQVQSSMTACVKWTQDRGSSTFCYSYIPVGVQCWKVRSSMHYNRTYKISWKRLRFLQKAGLVVFQSDSCSASISCGSDWRRLSQLQLAHKKEWCIVLLMLTTLYNSTCLGVAYTGRR